LGATEPSTTTNLYYDDEDNAVVGGEECYNEEEEVEETTPLLFGGADRQLHYHPEEEELQSPVVEQEDEEQELVQHILAPNKTPRGLSTRASSLASHTSTNERIATAAVTETPTEKADSEQQTSTLAKPEEQTQTVVHPSLKPFYVIDTGSNPLDTDYFKGQMRIMIRTPDVDDIENENPNPHPTKASTDENGTAVQFFRGGPILSWKTRSF
jgi:hypothetical protein